jgi:hypothetical protein
VNRSLADRLRRPSPALLAPHGWVGLLLVALAWPLNWALPGLRTHLLFFPLWLGYVLLVDALVLRRRGTSILTRSPRDFALLFGCSVPVWWLFEAFNLRTQNWQYLGGERFGPLTYFVLTSLSFSTVMPAIFETAELVRSAGWMRRLSGGPRLGPSRPVLLAMLGLGFVMLALSVIRPEYFYPFLWGSVFFLVEPINAWRGRYSLLGYLRHGDWQPVAALALSALVCGFFGSSGITTPTRSGPTPRRGSTSGTSSRCRFWASLATHPSRWSSTRWCTCSHRVRCVCACEIGAGTQTGYV